MCTVQELSVSCMRKRRRGWIDLERELNRKVSGKEIQPTLERIEQKMVQNQHQETPEFKAIQQKLESLQLPTPPIPKTPKLPGL